MLPQSSGLMEYWWQILTFLHDMKRIYSGKQKWKYWKSFYKIKLRLKFFED
jgi:hypothetical protein